MNVARSTRLTPARNNKPRRFVFVLMENFTLLSFASAVESLRIANRMSGTSMYEWRIIGEGGDTVSCSAGTAFQLDGDPGGTLPVEIEVLPKRLNMIVPKKWLRSQVT